MSDRQKNGLDAFEIAMKLAPQQSGRAMHVPGRGWFVRDTPESLWTADTTGSMTTTVQGHHRGDSAARPGRLWRRGGR